MAESSWLNPDYLLEVCPSLSAYSCWIFAVSFSPVNNDDSLFDCAQGRMDALVVAGLDYQSLSVAVLSSWSHPLQNLLHCNLIEFWSGDRADIFICVL
jgi:hypothetical protein